MIARRMYRVLNGMTNLVIVCLIFLLAAYSIYALWDNHQIYAAVDNVQDELLKIKPEIEEDGKASFEELLAINPDVCAWVTLDNTAIDHPIVQGEDILEYLNKDVYGNFALAGSIFLDTANDNTFHDSYSLVYGHHMANHKMFGDLDLYKDETFFGNNTTGTLILPDRSYQLEIFAVMLVSSSEDAIFDPEQWNTNVDGLLDFTKEQALYLHEDTITALEQDEIPQVLGLSTCSTDFTDARTIVLARMVPASR